MTEEEAKAFLINLNVWISNTTLLTSELKKSINCIEQQLQYLLDALNE